MPDPRNAQNNQPKMEGGQKVAPTYSQWSPLTPLAAYQSVFSSIDLTIQIKAPSSLERPASYSEYILF